MKELLFLVHRIPYPPNKGDKIRSFHILKYLSSRYRVHLGTFIDDAEDWYHVEALRQFCDETCIRPLRSGRAKLRSLRGLITGEALTLPYYRDAKLQTWVDSILRRGSVKRLIVYGSAMAQYVTQHFTRGLCSVIDFVDVDSDKWHQFSDRKVWPVSWLYRRESINLLHYEQQVASQFSASIFVSRAEAALFEALAPGLGGRITHMNNGVDTDYFAPDREYNNPYDKGERVLVFTGAMDYWANVDAVCWFAKEIFPTVQRHLPAARLYIVGARPVKAVRQLAGQTGVRVTGRVADVRPYLAYASAAVAPLRIARGVQNKVLEAMAMERPVLTTSRAIAGIEPCQVFRHCTADDAATLAARATELLSEDEDAELAKLGRQFVLERYDWNKNLEQLVQLIEGQMRSSAALSKGVTLITDSAPYNVVSPNT